MCAVYWKLEGQASELIVVTEYDVTFYSFSTVDTIGWTTGAKPA